MYPVLQIIGSWLPFTVFATIIWCLNVLFYPIMWIIWWTMYLFSVWKYLGVTGRTFREMLADPHRDTITESPTYKRYLMRNGLLVGMKLAEHKTKGDIRSHFLNFHNDWVAFIQYYQACVQNCKKSLCDHLPACDELEDVLYWVYSISLCGIGVIYFMVRMLKYRMGYLTISRDKSWSKNRSKLRRRYHKQRSFERWKYKKRYYQKQKHLQKCNTTFGSNVSNNPGSGAFTTVLNIDQRADQCNTIAFDSDSSSVVCDNSANVHICNTRQSFVGELKPVSSHKIATIGGRGHAPSGIGTVNRYPTNVPDPIL